MKDFRGNELNINDLVVYYNRTSTSGGYLREAKVVGFCNRSGYECVKIVPLDNNGVEIGWYKMTPKVCASHKIVKICG